MVPVLPAAVPGAPLQAGSGTVVAIVGTVVGFGLFLTITAHLAARNVLGDVPLKNASVVGFAVALIAIGRVPLGLHPAVALAAALVVDGALVSHLYGVARRRAAFVVFVHFVVSVLLGAIVYGLAVLFASAPG